jgi:uncharacterized membrane protein
MPDAAIFCPGCGCLVRRSERAHGVVGVLPEKLAGGLAYFVLPAVAFLLVPPYNKNPFVRFHCFQCLGVCLSGLVIGASLRVAGFVLFFIPVGRLFFLLISMVASLRFFLLWIVAMVKALQGDQFRLPLIGDIAERKTTPG